MDQIVNQSALMRYKHAEAQDNLNHIRMWQRAHPWGTQRECAKALGLSIMTVNKHVNAIRAEWRK